MTIFDLLFLALSLAAVITLIAAAVQWRRAPRIILNLVLCAALYIGIVYGVTALSKQKILYIGDPQCLDDWCFAVDHVDRAPNNATTRYDVTLRIFSRARRVAQRENGAKDVYLTDAEYTRYNPAPSPTEPPLNTLLQPGESVITHRTFTVPAAAKDLGLALDHTNDGFPFCMVIGECEAFHKATVIQMQ